MTATTMLSHHLDHPNLRFAVNIGTTYPRLLRIQNPNSNSILSFLLCRNYPNDGMDNIAAVIDPTYPISTPSSATPLGGPTGILPAHLDYTSTEHNSAPVPPYMPIQGTRRTNGISQPEKKKKSKDKCTHQ